MQKAADGEEFGVEDGGTGGTADEIVRQKRELDVEARVYESRTIPSAQQLLRFRFHFFFFAADEGHDVAQNVERSNARISCAGNGLHRDDENLFEAERIRERFEHQHQSGCRTVGIRNDKSAFVTAISLLYGNGIEV